LSRGFLFSGGEVSRKVAEEQRKGRGESENSVIAAYLFYLSLPILLQSDTMILSFGFKETERIWNGEKIKKLPIEIQEIGRRKLRMLNNSQNIMDLTIPPSNRLERLSGNLKSYYSIRVNDRWRIIFKWNDGNASDVDITDYH